MRTSRCGVSVALMFTLVCSLTLANTTSASASSKGGSIENCTLEIIGTNDDGSYEAGPLECVSGSPPSSRSSGFASMSSIIAVHYSGYNFSGSTLSISGGTCSGGWLNLPIAWRDRIASTLSPCTTRHYANLFLQGPQFTTTNPGGNLSSLAFDAESVKYD